MASVASLDRLLATNLQLKQGSEPEQVELLAESVTLLKRCLELKPDDRTIKYELAESLLAYGSNAKFQAEDIGAALDLFDQATVLIPDIQPVSARHKIIVDLSNRRRRIAKQLEWVHKPEQSRAILAADLRMFDHLSDPSDQSMDVNVCKALTLAALKRSDEGIPVMRSAAQLSPAQGGKRENLALALAEWLTLDIPALDFGRDDDFARQGNHAPVRWAQDLVDSIQARSHAIGAEVTVVTLAGLHAAKYFMISGSIGRKNHELDHAAAIERRFVAFAQELVRRYPDDPAPQMVLSDAYVESAKNAWQRADDVAAVLNLERARDAARRATDIDPLREDARLMFENRKRRLANTTAPSS